MNPKQQAQLDKRTKELDAREEYLNKWESELKTAPLEIKILNESIKVKQQQFEALKTAENASFDKIKTLDEKIKALEEDKRDKISRGSLEVASWDLLITNKKAELREAKGKLKEIEAGIAERQRYANEQERLIADKAEEGNDTLISLQTEVKDLQAQKNIAEEELIELNQNKTNAQYDLQIANEQFDSKQIELIDKQTAIENDIAEANRKLAEVQAEHNKTTEETDLKLRALKLKEEELLAKREAINVERASLEEDKRRWRGTKSLYQL